MFDDFAVFVSSSRSEKVKNSQEEIESRRKRQLTAARKIEKSFLVLYSVFIFTFFSFLELANRTYADVHGFAGIAPVSIV